MAWTILTFDIDSKKGHPDEARRDAINYAKNRFKLFDYVTIDRKNIKLPNNTYAGETSESVDQIIYELEEVINKKGTMTAIYCYNGTERACKNIK